MTLFPLYAHFGIPFHKRCFFRILKIKIINDRTLQKQSIKPISMENHLPIFSYGNKMRLIIDIKSPS